MKLKEIYAIREHDGALTKLALPIKLPENFNKTKEDSWKWIFLEEMNALAYALWMARAERAETKYRFLRYMWYKLNQMAKPDKPLIKEIKKDFSKWAKVARKCKEYAQKFKDGK